jgi:hypothetical protein
MGKQQGVKDVTKILDIGRAELPKSHGSEWVG